MSISVLPLVGFAAAAAVWGSVAVQRAKASGWCSRKVLFAGGAAAAFAFAGVATSTAHAETVAVTHAHVYSMGRAGEIADGTVVVRDGVIASVGAGAAVPAGARVIDAHGGVVTPGLVMAGSPISTVEIAGVDATADTATTSPRLSAAFDVSWAVNPDSTQIPIARMGGVTDAVVMPAYGADRGRPELIFAGQGAVIHLGGGAADPVRRARAAMMVDLGDDGAARAGGSRASAIQTLRADLADARRYAANRAAFFKESTEAYNLRREDLEALIPVAEGRTPLVVGVHRAADIRLVLLLAREEKLRLVLRGAEEAWRLAPEIAAAGAPVMLNAAADLPTSFEQLGATLENAARLNAAGVTVVIENPPLFEGGRTPRYAAGRAVAHGLPYAAALAALTLNPAKVFGVADRIGSLEPGKDADLVVWSGDPLDTFAAPTAVFVKGVELPLRSRDTDLRDRYLAQDVAAGRRETAPPGR